MKSEKFFKVGSYFLMLSAILIFINGIEFSPIESQKSYNATSIESIFSLIYPLTLFAIGFLNLRLIRSGIPSTLLKIIFGWNFILFGVILIIMTIKSSLPSIIIHSIISLFFLLTILGKKDD